MTGQFEIYGLWLTGAVAVGALITAYATMRMWRANRRASKTSLPTLADPIIGQSQDPAIFHRLTFAVDNDHQAKWRVVSITARYLWRPLISEIGSYEYDAGAGVSRNLPKRWVRRVRYDPPIQSSTVLIRYDCPVFIELDFKLAMRSSPNETSRFPMRVKIEV